MQSSINEALAKRNEACRLDYASQRGRPFEHFFCPILARDEPVEICKGHVVPRRFKTSNKWVPQRADVDAFFGTIAEADFLAVVRDRNKDPGTLLTSPSLRRQHRPRLECEGREIEYYTTTSPVRGHTPVSFRGEDGASCCDLALKVSFDKVRALDGKKVEIVVERDYRPAVVASALKSAHLTMFSLFGYRYVFSPAGLHLGDILKTFFEVAHSKSRVDQIVELGSHFRGFEAMVRPLFITGNSVAQGTISDKWVLACMNAKNQAFAAGIVVKASETDIFCVFVPGSEFAIDTYYSFLNEPPPSIAAKFFRFVRETPSGDGPHWETGPDEPFRIPFSSTE